MVDAGTRDAVEDRLARRRIAPLAPVQHQRALGVRVEAAGLLEEVAPGHAVEPLPGEHDGDVVVRRGEGHQPVARIERRLQALDAVVAPVAVAQRRFDVAQGVDVVVDREQHRVGHLGILPS